MISGPNGKRTLITESDIGAGDVQRRALWAGAGRERGERDGFTEMGPHQAIIAAGKPARPLAATIVGQRSAGAGVVWNRGTDCTGVRAVGLGRERVGCCR